MRNRLVVLITAIILVLAGCGTKSSDQTSAAQKSVEEATIKIFMPTEYLNDANTVEEWDPTFISKKIVKADGVEFLMTSTQYEQLKKDTKANLKAMFMQIEKSSKFQAVQSIEVKNEYDSIRVNVDKKAYKKMNRDALFQTMGLPIIHYLILNNEQPDSFVIECEVFDANKEENIEVINLPMDLSNGVLN
ncbi:hypothetical protein [Kurthia sibirica]|uniref:Uncharacterized protein n=1 Tax=Kurthia sibirica TaxID=202750 RepID=A0A2U3AP34_9BACL|nr:hypothetical protein [Kurthia sibirica]PWI26297.1 hypothetical protein DEX24_02885 [Kurthia sibirica]GEK35035.1 hypothetical protein KSI01_25680 [Kurthia sibirica]